MLEHTAPHPFLPLSLTLYPMGQSADALYGKPHQQLTDSSLTCTHK
jgi:hypothetical protein